MSDRLVVSEFRPSDERELFAAYAAAVEEGGSFPRRPLADLATFRSAWLAHMTTVQVARLASRFVGSYFLRPAHPAAAGDLRRSAAAGARGRQRPRAGPFR
jgi:hypothetical protein